jgi:hypothetical protein
MPVGWALLTFGDTQVRPDLWLPEYVRPGVLVGGAAVPVPGWLDQKWVIEPGKLFTQDFTTHAPVTLAKCKRICLLFAPPPASKHGCIAFSFHRHAVNGGSTDTSVLGELEGVAGECRINQGRNMNVLHGSHKLQPPAQR